ncbi:GAP family protein [Thermodesulfobacteriota bacterium]
MFKLKNGLLLLLIIHILLSSEMTYRQSVIASGMISVTAMIWVSMPLLVYVWTGRQRDAVLEALKQWLIANNATLIIFLYLFIGISVLSSGIGELIPELLEVVFEAVV